VPGIADNVLSTKPAHVPVLQCPSRQFVSDGRPEIRDPRPRYLMPDRKNGGVTVDVPTE
jgi:hypothetical protein